MNGVSRERASHRGRQRTTASDPVATFDTLVQTLRAAQAVHGDQPWLVLELTMAQLKAVMLLVHAGGMRSRQLADALGIGPSAVTPLVDRLIEQRLVRREGDPNDRRIIWIRPTPRAIAVNRKLLHIKHSLLARILAAVPRRQRAEVDRSVLLLLESAKRLLAGHQ